VGVSSRTSLPGLSRTKAVKRLCVCHIIIYTCREKMPSGIILSRNMDLVADDLLGKSRVMEMPGYSCLV